MLNAPGNLNESDYIPLDVGQSHDAVVVSMKIYKFLG
jgi:hypothetical protein